MTNVPRKDGLHNAFRNLTYEDRLRRIESALMAGPAFDVPVRFDYGVAGISSNFTGPTEVTHTDGTPRRHVVTPIADCWVEFGFHTIVQNIGVNWGRVDSYLTVTPGPPVLGGQIALSTWGRDIKYSHPTTGWVGIESRTWIPLSAGVTYTVTASLAPTTETWQHYRGEFMWFERSEMRRR